MDLERYLQEIEALVQHLSPHAGLLGDMDLYVIEEWYTGGVPLEAALAGTRKGAQRLQLLKRPPKGLPLRRVRPDVKKEIQRFASPAGARAAATRAVVSNRKEPTEDGTWRTNLRTLARETPEPVGDTLRALAEDALLGEERAFVRFLAISGEYYQGKLDALGPDGRRSLMAELATSARAALAPMSPSARDELLQELARRRLASEDPVLEPRRFWQD